MDNNSPSPSISIKPKDSTIDSKFGVVVTTPNYLQFFSDVPSYYQFLKDPKNYKDLLLGTVNIGNLIRNYLFINPEFKQLVRDILSDIEIPSIDTDTIVTIEGEQEVKGRKDFTGGLAVNGQNLIYDPVKKAWQLTGDLVVTGAVTMFGSLSGFTPSTVTDAVLVDGKTIVKTKNSQGQWQLTATGGGGGEGGGLTSDEVNILIANALSPVNKNLATKWTQDDTKITNWDSAFKWGDHSKAGYMKSTDFDTQLKKYILKDTVEQISARHNFTDGLQIAGINIYKSQDKTIYLDANLVVSGAFAMFGKNSTTFETIWKDIPFDDTMEWTGSVWRVKGGGSGSLDTNAVNVLISEYLNRTGEEYAKQSWVNQQGFANQSALTAVDNRLSAVETFFATEDSDTLINKWSEIVAFLNATEGDTLDNILATKANQSALDAAVASLTAEIGKKWTQNDAKISNWDSAYGWGNHANAGYAAKTYVDAELEKYVKLATAQSIEAQHNFVNGLQIGSLPITKSASANNTIYLDANLVVSGAITMFGSGSTTFPTIWANIPFDLNTMEWTGSVWRVKGGGSGSLDTNAVNVLIYDYLTQNSYATISDISSALVGYATQSWVGDNYLANSGGTITTDSIAGFSIYRNNGEYSAVHFYNTQDGNKIDVGYLGAAADGRPVYINAGGGVMDLIHSGNIGQQSVNRAASAGVADSANIATMFESVSLGITDLNEYKNTGAYNFHSSVNAPNSYISNMLVLRYSPDWGSQIVFDSEKNIFVRNWRDIGGVFDTNWRTVAFTDSNVASADVLKKSFANEDINYGAGDGLKLIYCHGNPGSYADAYHSGISVLTDYTGWQLTSYGGDIENPYFRSLKDDGTWKAWRQLAFLDDNTLSPSSGTLSIRGNIAIGGSYANTLLHVHGRITAGDITANGSIEVGGYVSSFSGYTIDNLSETYCGLMPNRLISSAGDSRDLWLYNTHAITYQASSHTFWGDTTINGNLLTTGVITMFSQASMKDVIDYDGLSLAQLAQIKPARFTWKDGRDSLVHAGGIADEVMQVLPEVVYRTKDDNLTMDYGSAAFYIGTSLIKPVIELWEVKDKQQEEIKSLEKRVERLENENRQLRVS